MLKTLEIWSVSKSIVLFFILMYSMGIDRLILFEQWQGSLDKYHSFVAQYRSHVLATSQILLVMTQLLLGNNLWHFQHRCYQRLHCNLPLV